MWGEKKSATNLFSSLFIWCCPTQPFQILKMPLSIYFKRFCNFAVTLLPSSVLYRGNQPHRNPIINAFSVPLMIIFDVDIFEKAVESFLDGIDHGPALTSGQLIHQIRIKCNRLIAIINSFSNIRLFEELPRTSKVVAVAAFM